MNSKPTSIAFSDEQYRTLRRTCDRWWKGELGRPIAKDPGQLYFDERRFASDRWDEAKRYGERFGIEVRG